MARFDERDDIRERYGKPQRPAVQFTRRDDVRDLMKSPAGQNYGNMMDLQSQAVRHGGFDKGDPRVAELKAARRKYNREDKYNIGNLMGYNPTDVQDIYRQNSGVLREHARPTYKEMYPISDIAHQVVGGGGLTGMLLNKAIGKSKKAGKNFFDDLRGMGGDIFGAIGIGGAVPRDEATEEILTNYATETFGTDEYEGPWPHEDMPLLPVEAGQPPAGAVDVTGEWASPGRKQDIEEDITVFDSNVKPMPNPDYGDLEYFDWVDKYYDTHNPDGTPKADPTIIPGHTTSYVDRFAPIEEQGIVEEVIPPVPFDDSGREAGIASLYGQGPQWGGTNRRYEDEYRDYVERIGDMPGGVMTYEEFSEAWEGKHQGKPHAGLR